MRNGISITVYAADRRRLEAVVADRSSPQNHVWRARIVLLSKADLGTLAIMRETGKSKTCVWRWQERFMEEGVAGLLRDKMRPSRIAPLARAKVDEILALTKIPPPHEATHWTGPAMAVGRLASRSARCSGIGARMGCSRIASGSLSSPRIPHFAKKLAGYRRPLYGPAGPRGGAVCLDEKSQIQAIDRRQPGLPMKKGRCGTMTHDYVSGTAPRRSLPP